MALGSEPSHFTLTDTEGFAAEARREAAPPPPMTTPGEADTADFAASSPARRDPAVARPRPRQGDDRPGVSAIRRATFRAALILNEPPRPMRPEFHRIRRFAAPTSSRRSTASRPVCAARAATSSISAWAIPTCPRPAHIVDKLVEAAHDPKSGRYSASRGIPGLRRAMAAYYRRRFGVDLDPDTEVVATMGSKEGFASICAQGPDRARRCDHLSRPGLPDPRLRLHHGHGGVDPPRAPAPTPESLSLRGEPRRAPLLPRRPASSWSATRQRIPPAQWVDLDFYREVVALARRHDMLGAISDIAYAEIYFEDNPPPSILPRVDGDPRSRGGGQLPRPRPTLHGRLAHGHGGRQCADVRGPGAGEVLPRLRGLHADPGGGRRRVERTSGLCVAEIREPPTRPGATCLVSRPWRQGRLDDPGRRRPRCSPGRRSPRLSARRAPWCSPSF